MGEGPRRQVPRFNRTPQSLPLLLESKEPQRMPSLDLDGGVCPVPIYHMPAGLKTGGLQLWSLWPLGFSLDSHLFWWEWTKPNKGPHYPAIHAEKAMPQSMTGTGTGHWTFDKRQGQASKSSRHAATRHKRPNHGAGRSAPIDVSLQPSPHPWTNTYKSLVSLPTPPWRFYRSVVPIFLDSCFVTTILSSGVYSSQLDLKERA